MAADTYDTILGLVLQGTGNNNNTWGTIHDNSGFKPLARAIAGVNTISSTGGSFDLSATVPPAGLRSDVDAIQLLSATLSSALTVIVPNVSKIWWFENDTSGAFGAYLKLPTGTSANGGLVQIPQGVGTMVMCDGAGHLRRLDRASIGEFVHFGGNGLSNVPPSGTLLCDGSSLLRTDYPDLFNAIGTVFGSADGLHFTLPRLTDTGRFLRSIIPSGIGVGTYQSNQNQAHTHGLSGALSVGSLSTDSQGSHSHTATDSGHSHVQHPQTMYVASGPVVSGGTGSQINPVPGTSTNVGTANVSIAAAGAHSHNVTGIPGLGTLATVSQGGTESRPEAMGCIISIRY